MTEFGAEIAVDGKQPDWLKDDHQKVLLISSENCDDWEGPARGVGWELTRAIKLPADHLYYKAAEAGYKYWPGGDKAPDDWNGFSVLLRDGSICPAKQIQWWTHKATGFQTAGDIIGYNGQPVAGSAPPHTPPAAGRYLSPGEVDELVRAVQAGDLAAAQALIVDPVVLRAREICRNHALYPVEPNSAFENAVVDALRESNRPTEQDVLKLARVAAYTVHLIGGIDMTGASTDYLAGKRDDESIAALVATIRNAI